MEEYYFKIGVRIPKLQISRVVSMANVSQNIIDIDFKKSFSKYSESQPLIFKVVSNVEVPRFLFLRYMFELCLDVSVDDMSLISISKNEYINQFETSNDSNDSDEIKECIGKMKYYTKVLKGKNIKNFDYKSFKKSGKHFIEQLKIAHESPKTQLEHSSCKYFNYQEGSKEATLCEIQLDVVE